MSHRVPKKQHPEIRQAFLSSRVAFVVDVEINDPDILLDHLRSLVVSQPFVDPLYRLYPKLDQFLEMLGREFV
jgi:hypothetical protein